MFQFAAFAFQRLFIHPWMIAFFAIGFPHSDIHGSPLVCRSPWRFAAFCVLRRLLAPRHSPFALFRLSFLFFFPSSLPYYSLFFPFPSFLPVGRLRFIPFQASSSLSGHSAPSFPSGLPCVQFSMRGVGRFLFCPSFLAAQRVPSGRFHSGFYTAARLPSIPETVPALGDYETRTNDFLLARQALSQLS